MKVYTKTGDKGTSQLFSGERRAKSDDVFNALGDTDELNAQIGVAIECARLANNEYLPPKLEMIQSRLFDLGACVATPLTTASQTKKNRAERRVVPLAEAGDVESVVIRYLNRLSDFLFVSARYAALKEGKEETKWQNQNIRPSKSQDE
ncbi:hypothetical protein P43SY_002557 [Pythium insidiosum]|uniref:Cobalamin adenosyltransferase-like domain-containing protein n=1 Tax=Pythium insidiosum TaxID=114742 RepID=A0AAD5MA40_PYTIN|nr:hypothetical protein P43SY_002557 [Pythium insidiosum]KAJ0412690.1 hypothetical protein ATCC90586_002320 [Pythium insidiosum]